MERMRKLLKFLSQRIVIVTFLIFLQVLWFVGLFLKFTSYSQYITGAFKILSILVVIYIMNRSDNPSVKLVWVIVILLFPLFGEMLHVFCSVLFSFFFFRLFCFSFFGFIGSQTKKRPFS